MWEGTVKEIELRAQRATLGGTLSIPEGAAGVVVFAHGSGSSRHSPRNEQVAEALNTAGFATLLFDLLTPEEEVLDIVTGRLRFDITLLADRLIAATAWLLQLQETRRFRVGYFGASTGAAAALMAAAELPRSVIAVVSRGGRPDLAGPTIAKVEAATLLIVGGSDTAVIEMNRSAINQLHAVKQIEIVPGATHLFEEPGALDMVATLATRWFENYLTPPEESVRSTAS